MMDTATLFESEDTAWLERPDADVEDATLERKRGFDAGIVAQAISAFGNSRTGGLVVVGVDSHGKIHGIKGGSQKVDEDLPKLRDIVEGNWKTRTVEVGGRTILYILVGRLERRVVALSDGRAFMRVGGTSKELKSEEIAELKYDIAERAFEDERATRYRESELDSELLGDFVRRLESKNGLSLPVTPESALRSRHLLVENSGELWLTHAGLLLFDPSPARLLGGARVRFLRFDGREERMGAARNVVKDEWFDGPLPRLLPRLLEFIRTQVFTYDYLGADGRFVNEAEYPPFAWSEAIVNALVHRSYSLTASCVYVRKFDDRIEVESPGRFPGVGFPSPAKPEEMHSIPRNPHLAGALQYFEFVRLAQEGTRRMAKEMRDMGLDPPLIEERNRTSVRVTLRNDVDRRAPARRLGVEADAWRDVAEMFANELYILKVRAIESAEALVQQGAVVPASVIDAFVQYAREPQSRDDVSARAINVAVRSFGEDQARSLLADYLRGQFNGRPHTESAAGNAVRQRRDVAKLALDDIERNILNPTGLELAFGLVRDALSAERRPETRWIQRVLQAATAHSHLRSAAELCKMITGHSPSQ